MKRSDARDFADILIICVLSIVDLFTYLIAGSDLFTDLISVLFLGFIPGYLIIELVPFLLKLDWIERLMISFSFSAAIGGASYYVTYALGGPISLVTVAFISIPVALVLVLAVLYVRVNFVTNKNRGLFVVISYGIGSELRSMGKRKRFITFASVLIIAVIVIASLGLLTTVSKERYSEFYILNEKGQAYNLPHNFKVGAGQQTILGVANHEGRAVTYFIEIWLVNYTMVNGGVNVKHMYAYAAMNITLESTDVDTNSAWVPQYESLVPLNFSIPGGYYLYFMLFKDSPDPLPARPFNPSTDYSTDVPATNRIVDAVNNRIQYLRMSVDISAA